jgi:hypothetical protein
MGQAIKSLKADSTIGEDGQNKNFSKIIPLNVSLIKKIR